MKMKTLLEIINKNNFFYISSLLLIVACGFFLSFYTRADGFMFMNSYHTAMLTVFFQNITFCGDGLFTLLLFSIIILSFKKHRKLALLLLIGFLSSGIFSQILKHLIASPRPSVYFESHHYTYFLDTFSNCRVGFHSFPSGHTASAFAMVTIITNYFRRRHIWAISLLFAMTIGYSRIYLAHHFLIDVLAGAFIGVLSGTLTILWYNKSSFKIKKIIVKNQTALYPLRITIFKNLNKQNANGSY
jgi:membrane-associated phospholipid phosphatase